MIRHIAVGVIAVVSLVGCGSNDTAPSTDVEADTVSVNAKVYAGNVEKPWHSSVAIDDEWFVYVGDDASSFIGANTKVFDLGGKTVIPGIIDAHSHPGFVALTGGQLLLDEASTKEELMRAIEKMVAENPDREIIFGGFWANELFDVSGPRKGDLDNIESARPVILYDAWAHTVWANSAALEWAGVNRDTKDVVPGFAFYQKDESGEPTG